MALDPDLDKPWVDFETNLDAIRIGKIKTQQSKLYHFLKPEIQHKINKSSSTQERIKIIEKAYGLGDVVPFWENIDTIYQHGLSQQILYEIRLKLHLIDKSKYEHDWISYEKHAFNSGLHAIVSFAMMLTFKRFHRDFQINDFLCCYIVVEGGKILSSKPIYRQMIASRINYILHGTYLPIISYFCDQGDESPTPNAHATTQLLIPIVSRERLTWNVLNINSNGSDEYRYFMDSTSMLDEYKLWTVNQRQTRLSHKNFNCVENIQKNFGLCGYWSTILVFQCFLDFHRLFKTDADNFDAFCKYLSVKTSYYVVINRINNYMMDIGLSFYQLILHVSGFFHKDPSISEIGSAILRGPISKNVLLDLAIFKHVDTIRRRLQKYMKQSMVRRRRQQQHNDNQTDEESPSAMQRRIEHVDQIKEQQEAKQKEELQREEEILLAIAIRKQQLKGDLAGHLFIDFESWTDSMKDVFRSSYEEFVSLLPDTVLNENRTLKKDFVTQWFAEKHNAEIDFLKSSILKRDEEIRQLTDEIAKWSEILKENPNAPPVRMYETSFRVRTLLDDVGFNNLLIRDKQKEQRQDTKTMRVRELVKPDDEVEIFLSIDDKIRRTAKKHRRDDDD